METTNMMNTGQPKKAFKARQVAVISAAMLAAVCLIPAASAQYKDYPQIAGKTQPLHFKEMPSWLGIDMDLRARSEGQTAFNYVAGTGQGYELTRVWGGLTVTPTHWLTGYAQFMDSHALALPVKYVASNMRDNFDLRQGYLEVHGENMDVRAGRQELRFGGERLVGISDWTNVSRTFDGFRGTFGEKNRIDLFSASVVTIHPGAFDDHAGGLNFHGAYGTLSHLVPKTTIEPYVFVKAMPSVKSQQSIYGTETEVTPGMRVLGNAPLGFDYIAEGALQRGSYSNDSIHAGAGYTKVGWTGKMIPWTPRLQGEYDYATGNPHTNAKRIGTFDQLYPSAHNAFGLTDLLGWQNIQQERINLDLNPVKHLTVLLQQGFLQVATQRDGLYSGSASEFLKPPTKGLASDDIGKEFDASAKYVFHDYFVTNVGVGHFFPAAVMTENSHAAPQTIAYLALIYRFKVTN
jgi:hypothetical protein